MSPAPGQPTVLVVEDEALVRISVAEELQDRGFAVKQAADVQQAMEILESHRIDLVFTDVNLPGGPDGFSLAQWVHANKPRLPVILTSGDRTAIDAARGARKPFFAKPYDIAEVATRMRGLLAEDEAGQSGPA
jgi:DNA-binding response OmpR family regulator